MGLSHIRLDSTAPVDRWLRLDFEVELALTLGPLRYGPGDPTMRIARGIVWRATRTRDGAATVRISRGRNGWRVMAWGRGAEVAAEAVPRLLGAEDEPGALLLPAGRLRDLMLRLKGLRFGRSDAVMESLIPAIIGQKVTAREAQRAYRGLVARFGEPAPGPGGLRLAPSPERLAALPYFELHPLGLEQRRAVTIIRASQQASWLEEAVELSPAAALARLRGIPGVGAWTAAETARSALGDPDVVSLGDFHIPNMVCWALAGEPRGDDVRMLELLEPYRGQRGRLVRILELSGITAPKYGPRSPPRSIGQL
ncbi:MAG: DNA-3-methyladenine glycosylase [Chloroflexota bacterium]